MGNKDINLINKKIISSLILTVISAIICTMLMFPAETVVLCITAIYLLMTHLKIKGNKVEIKDFKNLVVFANAILGCFNLIKVIFMQRYFSGAEIVASAILATYYVLNTLFVHGLFKGEQHIKSKTMNIVSILQLILLVLLAIRSDQYWIWGNVAFAIAACSFTAYFISYKNISEKTEEDIEIISLLGINEDNENKQTAKNKKTWQKVVYVLVVLMLGLITACQETLGAMLIVLVIFFVEPLIYIYRLGDEIKEPKGMLYISYFMPLVGMILYLIYVRTVSKLGNACGKAALLGVIMPVAAFIAVFVLFLGLYPAMPIPLEGTIFGI